MISKRLKAVESKFQTSESLTLSDALSKLGEYVNDSFTSKSGAILSTKLKFDETVSLEFELGVDGKRSDQMVKSSVILPFSHGKNRKVLAITSSVSEAITAGAFNAIDRSGLPSIASKELNLKDIDLCLTSEEMMKDIATSGCSKVLGLAGLMPNVKSGTVFKTEKDLIANLPLVINRTIEIKSDKFGYLKVRCGKLSFKHEDILSNIDAIFEKVKQVKPASVKGVYIKSVSLSSTGGFVCYLNFKS